MIRFFIPLLLLASLSLYGQNPSGKDSLRTVQDDSLVAKSRDTVLLKSYATRYNPRKALLYSAVVPGLGQIYNKKYWKLPLVYGGMGLIAYNIQNANVVYRNLKTDLFYILNNPGQRGQNYNFDEASTRSNITRVRRTRDLMVILMGGVYLLQMIDAHVDAHLKEFDLNPNLQVRLEPMLDNDPMIGRQAGFSIYFKF